MRALIMGSVLLTTGTAGAQERDETFQAAAMHIVTAYECEKITGDTNSLEVAYEKARERMTTAGYDHAQVDQSITEIKSNLGNDPAGPLTAGFCRDMLKIME